MPKFTQIELCSEEDPEYLATVASKINSKTEAARLNRLSQGISTVDLDKYSELFGRLGTFFERIVSRWLSNHFILSDKRILSFFQNGNGPRYYELDVVSLKNNEPDWVFEVKVTRRYNVGTSQQLPRIREVLHQRWPNAKQALILVDSRKFEHPTSSNTLEVDNLEMILTSAITATEVPVLLFSLADLIQYMQNHDDVIDLTDMILAIKKISFDFPFKSNNSSKELDNKFSASKMVAPGLYLNTLCLLKGNNAFASALAAAVDKKKKKERGR